MIMQSKERQQELLNPNPNPNPNRRPGCVGIGGGGAAEHDHAVQGEAAGAAERGASVAPETT